MGGTCSLPPLPISSSMEMGTRERTRMLPTLLEGVSRVSEDIFNNSNKKQVSIPDIHNYPQLFTTKQVKQLSILNIHN